MFDYKMISISHGKDHTSESLELHNTANIGSWETEICIATSTTFCLVMGSLRFRHLNNKGTANQGVLYMFILLLLAASHEIFKYFLSCFLLTSRLFSVISFCIILTFFSLLQCSYLSHKYLASLCRVSIMKV